MSDTNFWGLIFTVLGCLTLACWIVYAAYAHGVIKGRIQKINEHYEEKRQEIEQLELHEQKQEEEDRLRIIEAKIHALSEHLKVNLEKDKSGLFLDTYRHEAKPYQSITSFDGGGVVSCGTLVTASKAPKKK